MKDIDKIYHSNIFRRLDEFPFSKRVVDIIKNENLLYVGDLAILDRFSLLRIPQVGQNTIKEVDTFLNSLGLYLGMNIPNWPPDAQVNKIVNEKKNLNILRPVDTLKDPDLIE